MSQMNMIQAIRSAHDVMLEKDPSVVAFGQDIGFFGGVFRCTDGLQKKYGEHRVIDAPIAEGGIVGTAIGLGINGLRPVVEIQFADYIYPGFDQIVSEAAKMRYRSGGQWTCPMVIRTPSGGGIRGGHYHSQSSEAYFAHTPGLRVVMPSTPREAKGLLLSSIFQDDPVLFMEPKRIYRAFREEVPEDEYTVPIGKARVVVEGDDVTLISWGAAVIQCMNAIEKSDRSIELIDLRTIDPMDTETIINSVKKTGRAVIVHEAPRNCGLGAEIASRIVEQAFLHLEAPVQRVTGFDTLMPYYKLELDYLPEEPKISKAIEEVAVY